MFFSESLSSASLVRYNELCVDLIISSERGELHEIKKDDSLTSLVESVLVGKPLIKSL